MKNLNYEDYIQSDALTKEQEELQKEMMSEEFLNSIPSSGIGSQVAALALTKVGSRHSHLVNLFRCVKYHEKALEEELKWYLSSRELFQDAKAQVDIRGITDIQRVAWFYMMIKNSFGAKLTVFSGNRSAIHNVAESLEKAHQRLERVVIENRDFSKVENITMLIAYPKEIEDAEEHVQNFLILMNGCSRKEMRFILKTMTNIKQNLKEVS